MNLENARSRFLQRYNTLMGIEIILFVLFTALVAFGFLATLPRLIPVPYQYDFTAYYVAAQVLNANEPLYQAEPMIQAAKSSNVPIVTPYLYPPVVAALLRPLALLPFDIAAGLWYLLNLICLVISIGILLRIMRYQRTFIFPVSLITLTLSPVFLTLLNGQITVLLLLLLLGSFYHSSTSNSDFKKELLSGVLAGVATALKLYPGLMGIYFLIHRKFVSLFSMIISVLVMFMIGIIAGGGISNTDYWITKILPNTSQLLPHPFLTPSNQSVFAVVERLFSTNPPLEDIPSITLYPIFDAPKVGEFLSYLLAGIILVFTFAWPILRLVYTRFSSLFLSDFALLLTAIVLITPVVWAHYYILLLPAVFILVQQSRSSRLPQVILLLGGILIELERYFRWIIQPMPIHSAIFASFGFAGTLLLWGTLLWLTFPMADRTLVPLPQAEHLHRQLMSMINHK